MAEFDIVFKITNSTESDALDAMNWLSSNHGVDVKSARMRSIDLVISGQMSQPTFIDSVALIQALKAEFSTRLEFYSFEFRGG